MKKHMPPVMPPVYVGIDPGKSEGVVVYAHKRRYGTVMGSWIVEYKRLDAKDPRDLYRQLFLIAAMGYTKIAMMEKAGMHRAKNSAMSSAAAARHNGHLEMALVALGFTFDIVQPRKWMDTLGPGRPKDRAERKTWIHEIVKKRHPDMKIHKYAGDAVAIFDYMLAEKGIKIDY